MATAKKVPIVAEKRAGPPPAAVRNSKYPFRTMSKGESFFVACKNLDKGDAERQIEVQWDSGKDQSYPVDLRVVYSGEKGMLATLSSVLGQTDARVVGIRVDPRANGLNVCKLTIEVKDTDHLPRMQAAGRPVRQKNVFRALARKRVGFLLDGARRSLTQGFHYTVRDFRLLLSVHLPGRLRDFARREELLSLREAMVTTLNAAAFPSRPFDAADLIAWCAIFCNPQRILVDAPPPTYDEGRELFEQIVDFATAQEALADGRGLRTIAPDLSPHAALEVRCYAVKTFPERFALWQMGGLTGDLLQGALQYPCPFLLTLGVETLEPETTRGGRPRIGRPARSTRPA